MIPIREQVIQALVDRLKTILVSGGYGSDVGLNVCRARRTFNDKDLPVLVVWEGGESPNTGDSSYGISAFNLSIGIEALTSFTDDTVFPVGINTLYADIYKSLMGSDKTFGGLVDTLVYITSNPVIPEDGRTVFGIRVEFTVTYKIAAGDPYSSPV